MRPNLPSTLSTLRKARLAELGRTLGVSVPDGTREAMSAALGASLEGRWTELLELLLRDELKAVLRAHQLDDGGNDRTVLARRVAEAAGVSEAAPKAVFARRTRIGAVPAAGDQVQVRHRQYLVEEVVEPTQPGEATLVKLVCLDDDAQGRPLEVLWDLELGAQVVAPELHGLGGQHRLDPPRLFGAYLHALKWSAVSATDGRLFQSPFRAGIQLKAHQLAPLKKALELPRANLFIADDVGLGKTIEAGLVLQELILRQRVDTVIVVCPASVGLQWQGEMRDRFGLFFELFGRSFVARRRQERGFAVNPWSTHNRFIVSYQTLRRPEYLDPLLAHLGPRAAKSLLILDEAHTAAPSSPGQYAIDSRLTKMVREVAARFENRLFLSATPHNGHSNSFSSLLHILDPQRFMRGVPVRGQSALSDVMVRRLKSDLRAIGVDRFPERKIVPIDVGATPPTPEVQLADLLREYTALTRPTKGKGRLVFINLQKRLLSSVRAFHRTLEKHAAHALSGDAPFEAEVDATLPLPFDDDTDTGVDDETLDELDAQNVADASRTLTSPAGRARDLLDRMRVLAERERDLPDAKVRALVEWIRANQCPAVRLDGATGSKKDRAWSDTRVIVFTEYGDTKKYLIELLQRAIEGTDGADERILTLHGGMGDDQRAQVQRAFNGPPSEYPVRILIATDAAREGVNLQAFCADLFHFDLPWNPARLEQRNGRIDRTLQPAAEVRCHYFHDPARPEDRVLQTLVGKVETIRRELGSLGTVVVERIEKALAEGIDAKTADALDAAMEADERAKVTAEELESQRSLERLKREIDEAGEILNASQKLLHFDPELLREALDVGLALAGAGPMTPLPAEAPNEPPAFSLPELPASWRSTEDVLRPPRPPDMAPWDWRKLPPRPVVFRAPDRLTEDRVHLHLEHPFVQRILQRLRTQGFAAHDLSRVTVLRTRHDALPRVIAFGRLSLFGHGATRLHDQLIPIAARWKERKPGVSLEPLKDPADKRAIERLEQVLAEAPSLEAISGKVRDQLIRAASDDFADLWTHLKIEAEEEQLRATRKLDARGLEEAEALKRILRAQQAGIEAEFKRHTQLELALSTGTADEREQFEQERKAMQARIPAIDRELETEPAQLRALYQVRLRRLEPVGLVYLWPETRS